MHSMRQAVVFPRVSCDVRAQRQAAPAHEERAGLGTRRIDRLLRQAPARTCRRPSTTYQPSLIAFGLQKEQAEIREAALKAEEEQDEDQYNSAKLSKSARAYAKTYKPGPPLVPAIIIDRILQYISRTTIRKKQDFIAMMCRYWSLKREARRGAPLLKRLHLEPWTASTGAKMQGEEEKVMKLDVRSSPRLCRVLID